MTNELFVFPCSNFKHLTEWKDQEMRE